MKDGMMIVLAVCAIVLCIVFMKKKIEYIINFIIRTLSGGIYIYMLNQIVLLLGLDVSVGINLVSLLTCAILGFPGVLLLFGIVCL
ncbi:MAG: transcriptional regulator [Clostridia bacterium]|nr:transcriptional regulator [Clostridia bacterium]